jgi:dTDP-L-rhamnose 4-epimerase
VKIDIDLLVTGGAGFIGCALINGLVDQRVGAPPRIVAADCLHPQVHPNRERPAALPSTVELIEQDVCDADGWNRLLARFRPRVIVHLAAETGTGQSLDLPTSHTHTNVTGTAAMLEALDRNGCHPEHILLASSRAVYGEGDWLDPETQERFRPHRRDHATLRGGRFHFTAPSGQLAQPLHNDYRTTMPEPASVYGATKLAQEHVLQAWAAARPTRLSILRLQNVFGVGQSPYNNYTGIVSLFHRQAADGLVIDVYEDGLIGRDFISIEDIVQVFLAALGPAVARNRIIDVGTGQPTTILDAARLIASMYNAPPPRISGAFRDGDIRWAVASIEMLERELNFASQVNFATANLKLSHWLHEIGVIPRCGSLPPSAVQAGDVKCGVMQAGEQQIGNQER